MDLQKRCTELELIISELRGLELKCKILEDKVAEYQKLIDDLKRRIA
jgi:hypothetical protein